MINSNQPAKISYRKLNGDIKSESIITAVFPMSEYSGNSTNSDQNYPTLSAILINLDADTLHKNIASTSPIKFQVLLSLIVMAM